MEIKRPRAKRYNWFRVFNDFAGHPKWRLVARNTGVRLGDVEAIVIRLFKCSNKGRPRGSIPEFSCNEVAADLDLEPGEVVRVYQALEQTGWIDREYLTTWDERQPDKEDPTNADRQARWRDKRKEERGLVPSNGVTRYITPKTQTQNNKKEAPVTKLSTGQAVTWKDVQEAGYVPPKQRSLPLPPVPLRKKGA